MEAYSETVNCMPAAIFDRITAFVRTVFTATSKLEKTTLLAWAAGAKGVRNTDVRAKTIVDVSPNVFSRNAELT